MRTDEKMALWVHAINEGKHMPTKFHASIMVSGDRIYSYGTHYPLLFRITDKNGELVWVRNNGGYSRTTSKHIAYAYAHSTIDAPIGGTGGRTIGKDAVIVAITSRIKSLREQMDSKKRKNTKVYERLAQERARYQAQLARIIPNRTKIESINRYIDDMFTSEGR